MVSARTLAARPDPSGTAALAAAGATDPGVQRDVNEDRFHCDTRRGVFVVIDGVGGQAAGGRAADVALSALRARLDRQDAADAERVRDAITTANNEIYRLASTRPEWDGMACVLTIAVVRDSTATYGHVGDTRLYKLRGNTITKLTRDHSPVGEREDANEISERQAMLHPRRNEVYRDVGSEPHGPSDANFVDVAEVPFEPDAALLLCSDGLTDLVDSTSIARMVRESAGDPEAVVQALIRAANAAGGKDNVTAVYVEGERFAGAHDGRPPVVTRPVAADHVGSTRTDAQSKRRRRVVLAIVTLLLAGAVGAWLRTTDWTLSDLRTLGQVVAPVPVATRRIVGPSESIAAALRDAAPGSEIVVEPGEYREQLTLMPGVRLLSRVPGGATIRLPAAIPDGASVAAVMAKGVHDAVVDGFRISGDAATPLPVGIFLEGSTVSIVNVEITGATRAAVELSGEGAPVLMASDIHDNPGAAVIARDRTAARVTHNAFARNGTSGRGSAPLVVDGAQPAFIRNVFIGSNPASVSTLTGAAQTDLRRDNWFVPSARR